MHRLACYHRENARTRHLATSAGNSVSVEQPGRDGQSKPYTDLAPAQAAQGPTIVQVEAPHQAAELTMVQVEAADLATGPASTETQAAQKETLTRDTYLRAQEQYSGRSGAEHV